MSPLVRDAIEVLMVVAAGGAVWSALSRWRNGQVKVVCCGSCGRPSSATYARCPRCGAPT